MSEVLRGLAAQYPDNFIFKGGTSLSKAYGIVERFSDDIDLLVLKGDRGSNATDTLMKQMGKRAAECTGGTMTSIGGTESGTHRSYEVDYPTRRPQVGVVRPVVLLEMGIRGGSQPSSTVSVGCLLGDALSSPPASLDPGAFEDLAHFEVRALHPGRTLLEKLVLVHGLAIKLAADETLQPKDRDARHFYDVYQLLGDASVLELLDNESEVTAVIKSIGEVTRTHFPPGTEQELRPAGGFADSPAFDSHSAVSARFRNAYEATIGELYYGVGDPPDWEQVCSRVRKHREQL